MSETTTQGGHELARQIIARHGTDRYPRIPEQALKVAAETGELADAILKHQTLHDGCPRDQLHGAASECPHIRKEYADAGLALFELGNKLGLDLITCMTAVVNGETRTFAEASISPSRREAGLSRGAEASARSWLAAGRSAAEGEQS